MKIFLNDRIVHFLPAEPENMVATDLMIQFTTADKLAETWDLFRRYTKHRNLYIIDPSLIDNDEEGRKGDIPGKLERMNAMIESDSIASFLSFFKSVPAAGGLVRNEKGEYLFIHRLGHWDLPKGKIGRKDFKNNKDKNSLAMAARSAAMREVMEETGLSAVTITRELPSTWHIYTEKDTDILKRVFWYEMTGSVNDKLTPQTSEGIFLVKWTPEKAIHCILTHTYDSIRDLLVDVMF